MKIEKPFMYQHKTTHKLIIYQPSSLESSESVELSESAGFGAFFTNSFAFVLTSFSSSESSSSLSLELETDAKLLFLTSSSSLDSSSLSLSEDDDSAGLEITAG